MKINKLILSSLLFLIISCGEFDANLNVDSSKVSKPYTNGLLTGFLRSIYNQGTIPMLYVQQLSQVQYTTESRYTTKQFGFGTYTRMNELQKIIDLNNDAKTKDLDYVKAGGDSQNQISVAEILKCFYFLRTTDSWGPIPYSQALKGLKNIKPKYDSQKVIYHAVLDSLKIHAGKLKKDKALNGDILFEGDIDKWKLFAHSLRIIAAIKLADVDEAKLKEVFGESMTEAEKITGPINFKFLDETNNKNPWYDTYLTRTDYALSTPFVNKLKSLSDPRLAKYADKPKSGGDYKGMDYGVKSPSTNDNDVSLINSDRRKADSPLPLITRSQVMFAKAEAIARGFIAGDASQAYLEAIKASFEQWGISEADYLTYVNQSSVAWDKSKWQERLGVQKWISLFFQGHDAWAEWRRLDYPKLSPPAGDLNQDGGIPVRFGYPSDEVTLNKKQYEKGVELLGGSDHLSTRVWWDKYENNGEK